MGDFVRLSLRKHLFKKGYRASFTEEVLKITERLLRTPEVYKVQDLLERPISGTFCVKELQKVNRPDIFRIEKVLKHQISLKSFLLQWYKECSVSDSYLLH